MGPSRRGRALSVPCDWGTRANKSNDMEHVGFIRVDKPKRTFCTGSQYTGQWDGIGMSGFGTFVFPHNVEYEGHMKDGMFHGDGTLIYPMGQKMDGQWRNGRLVSMKYRFPDGLDYEEPWRYCQYPDRRFYTSTNEGLRPAGKELRTNNDPPRTIPTGCYDVGDGFYDPQTKCVVSPLNHKKIIRIPTAAEELWIITNCRKAWDEPTGYRPELYPRWFTGRRSDLDKSKSQNEIDHPFKQILKNEIENTSSPI